MRCPRTHSGRESRPGSGAGTVGFARTATDGGLSTDEPRTRSAEPAEYEIVKIPGSTLIPKGDIVSGAALAELPQDKPVILYCKSGVRSAEALAVLKNAGFRDATHVQGGVVGWVRQIDPSLPIY